MPAVALELEGPWEQILARASDLAGRRVRLTVLPEEEARPSPAADDGRSFWESREAEDIFSEQGIRPVADVKAFLRSLPHVKNAGDLWDAVRADREQRRAAAEAPQC